jgi:cupin 2 domain-containing protein
MITTANILGQLPEALDSEVFETLAQGNDVRVERIISRGQTTPAGEWYDQAWDEWVLLVTGGAELLLEGEGEPRRLGPGDHLLLPAHCRHRVTWTDPNRQTVWLAVHLGRQEAP